MRHFASVLVLALGAITFRAPAQETICDNGGDDDLDYLRDCADPDCSCPNKFQCTDGLSFVQLVKDDSWPTETKTWLREWDGSTWNLLYNMTYQEVNALAYDNLSGWLWAVNRRVHANSPSFQAREVMKLNRSSTVATSLILPAIASSSTTDYYNVGVCDITGTFYTMAATDVTMQRVDVENLVLLPSVTLNQAPGAADLAYSWRLDAFLGWNPTTASVVMIDVTGTTGTVTFQSATATGGNSFPTSGGGSAFCDALGNLYIYFNSVNNDHGEMWLFTTADQGVSWTGSLLFISNKYVFTDGALCPLCNPTEPRPDCEVPPLFMQQAGTAPEQIKTMAAPPFDISMEKPSGTYLVQNQPNPSANETVIRYCISNRITGSAILAIYTADGSLVESHQVPVTVNGQFALDVSAFTPGNYHFTLSVDGELVDAKVMVVEDR